MNTNRKVITNGYIISMDDSLGDLSSGAILIENDIIAAVTATGEELRGVEAEVIDAQGGIILPGLVDAHRHDWLGVLRGLSADESLPEFLANTFYAYGAIFSAEDMHAAVLAGILEALDAGTTSIFEVNDCVNTPDHARAAVDAMRVAGIRGVYGYGMQAYNYAPRSFIDHKDRLKDAAELRKAEFFGADDLLRMGMLMTDFGTVPFNTTASEIRLARDLDLVRASHTAAASTSILLKGLRELNDHGLLLPGHLHAHSNALTEQDWKIIADTGGKIVTTPSSELQMGMGGLPIRSSLTHGITPAFGTDLVGVASGSLFQQMDIGLQWQRSVDNSAVHKTDTMPFSIDLSARDALYWGTRGGAQALGLDDTVGSLTPGKKADCIILSQKRAFTPSRYPVGTVVQQTSAADVDTVILNGEIRKRHGKLIGYDLDAVRANAMRAFERLNAASTQFTAYTPEEIAAWFRKAERAASVNFADAYRDGIPGDK